MNSLSFLNYVNKVEHADRFLDEFSAKLKQFGFDRFTYVGLRLPRVTIPQPVIITSFPPEWYTRYNVEGYTSIDPIIREASKSLLPFEWNVHELANQSTRAEKNMLGEAGEFGVVQGLTIPVCGHFGEFGWVSVASDDPGKDMAKAMREHKNDLHLLAIYYHAMVAESLADKNIEPKTITLTQREKEILHWLASGKSAHDIADIIGCKRNTVIFHIENAKEKFGVRTFQQAIVKAVLLGLIQP